MSEDVTASASGAEEVATEEAQLEGGNYEVIRRRLIEQGETLRAKAAALNEQRTAIFGTSTLEVLANARVRTDHNCVPCDIVMVQGCLLFGYNVFVGLKRDVAVEDVFSMQRMVDVDGSHVDFEPSARTIRPPRSSATLTSSATSPTSTNTTGRRGCGCSARSRTSSSRCSSTGSRARHPRVPLDEAPRRVAPLRRQPRRARSHLPADPRLRLGGDAERGPGRGASPARQRPR